MKIWFVDVFNIRTVIENQFAVISQNIGFGSESIGQIVEGAAKFTNVPTTTEQLWADRSSFNVCARSRGTNA